jgi:hypothetical protein
VKPAHAYSRPYGHPFRFSRFSSRAKLVPTSYESWNRMFDIMHTHPAHNVSALYHRNWGEGASKKGAAINNLQIITNRTEESGSLCAAKRRNKPDAAPIQSHRFTRTCPKQNRSPRNHTTTHQIKGRSGRESREIPVPGFRVRARNRFEVDEMGAAEAAACERKSCGCVCLRVGGRRWQPGTRERESTGERQCETWKVRDCRSGWVVSGLSGGSAPIFLADV